MKNIMDFLSAALPWISIGLLLAIFSAQNVRKKKDKKNVYWKLMDDIRTEHITRLTKEEWRKN